MFTLRLLGSSVAELSCLVNSWTFWIRPGHILHTNLQTAESAFEKFLDSQFHIPWRYRAHVQVNSPWRHKKCFWLNKKMQLRDCAQHIFVAQHRSLCWHWPLCGWRYALWQWFSWSSIGRSSSSVSLDVSLDLAQCSCFPMPMSRKSMTQRTLCFLSVLCWHCLRSVGFSCCLSARCRGKASLWKSSARLWAS